MPTSRKATRRFDLIFYGAILLIADVFLYGWILPFLAVMLTALFTERFHFYPGTEIIFVVCSVIGIFALIVNLKMERRFWKRFFAQDKPFMILLSIRESVNLAYLGYLIYDFVGIIESISRDNGLKPIFLTEGTMYVMYHYRFLAHTETDFLKDSWKQCSGPPEPPPVIESVDTSGMSYLEAALVWLEDLWSYGCSTLMKKETLAGSESESCLSFAKMIHAAQLSLTIAYITASVGKVIYFSNLNAYARAMELFVSMHRTSSEPITFNIHSDSEESTVNYLNDTDSQTGISDNETNEEDSIVEMAEEECTQTHGANERVDQTTSFSKSRLPSTRQLYSPRPNPVLRRSQGALPAAVSRVPEQDPIREGAVTQGFTIHR